MITTTVDLASFGELLRLWRLNAGLSLKGAAKRANKILEPTGRSLSYGTVQRYEVEDMSLSAMDSAFIVAITVACGHRVADLPSEVQEYIRSHEDLLRKSCFPLSHLVAA